MWVHTHTLCSSSRPILNWVCKQHPLVLQNSLSVTDEYIHTTCGDARYMYNRTAVAPIAMYACTSHLLLALVDEGLALDLVLLHLWGPRNNQGRSSILLLALSSRTTHAKSFRTNWSSRLQIANSLSYNPNRKNSALSVIMRTMD